VLLDVVLHLLHRRRRNDRIHLINRDSHLHHLLLLLDQEHLLLHQLQLGRELFMRNTSVCSWLHGWHQSIDRSFTVQRLFVDHLFAWLRSHSIVTLMPALITLMASWRLNWPLWNPQWRIVLLYSELTPSFACRWLVYFLTRSWMRRQPYLSLPWKWRFVLLCEWTHVRVSCALRLNIWTDDLLRNAM